MKFSNSYIYPSIFVFPLAFFASFRYPGLTPDTASYYEYTEFLLSGRFVAVEPFHIFLVNFLSIFDLSSQATTKFVFLVYFALTAFFTFKSVKAIKNLNFVLLIIFLQTYIYLNLVQMRYGLACSIILYGCSLASEKIIKKFLFIGFAASVHFFALIFFIVPLLGKLPLRIVVWIPFVSPLIPFSETISAIDLILSSLASLMYSDLQIISGKMVYYLDRISARDNIFNIFNLFSFISYLSLIVISQKNERFLYEIRGLVIGFCYILFLYILFLDIPIISRRLMLLQLLFAIPILIHCLRVYDLKNVIAFFAFWISLASFVNIGFVKSLIRL